MCLTVQYITVKSKKILLVFKTNGHRKEMILIALKNICLHKMLNSFLSVDKV